ncbi:FAD:protein FMN transferase [Fredinandcohnia sp. 179-A 10B2 NHS]|uniref:FAD:protein FMN transferase n=1 Tax=Fredinandcohnia sp. 179-A 10B2 NHS TaxID=3235176 RepID=UPI0039A00E39
MKKLGLLLVCLSVLFTVIGCAQKEGSSTSLITNNPYKRTEFLMGTVVTVKIYDEDKEEVLDPVFERIFELADRIGVNEEESEIIDINKNAGIQPVQVSADIYRLIEAGKAHSKLANGTFDISVGPLTTLWNIGFPDARKPEQEEINQVLPLIDYNQIYLNVEEQTVYLANQGMELDLGAIAKGFITDEVKDVLLEHDVHSAIIDLGGNIYVLGKNANGSDWTVGIQDPFSPRGEIVGKIKESNKSIVTSGVYERFLEVDGVKYHHILNPIDGYPYNNDVAGVSIITDKSIDGDALSTTLFSKGIQGGLEYIENIEDAEAIFVSQDKKIYFTSGLKGEFELTNDQFEVVN